MQPARPKADNFGMNHRLITGGTSRLKSNQDPRNSALANMPSTRRLTEGSRPR